MRCPGCEASLSIERKEGGHSVTHPGSGCDWFQSNTLSQMFEQLFAKPTTGSGDFSLGSKVWPGTSKLLEEMGELQQVLGKIIQIAGGTEHWDGDLRPKLVQELADVAAALRFFGLENLTSAEMIAYAARSDEKLLLFRKWHTTGDTRPKFDPPTQQMTGEEKRRL